MAYNRVVISSGHGKYIRGAADILDEVDCARALVELIATELRYRGVDVTTFHDDVSKTQSENLGRIVDFHNSKVRDLDISTHFNAYQHTTKAMGTEVLYVTQEALAKELSQAIANAGLFLDRGPKKRTDLAFLNGTSAPAVLLEVCFVDSTVDADLYKAQRAHIARSIADVVGGASTGTKPPTEPEKPTEDVFFVRGKCSFFGGPDDTGVSHSEGLAFHSTINPDNQQLFLPIDSGTGLARRLNPAVHYLACRWDYNQFPKSYLQDPDKVALVTNPKTGASLTAWPADWGPHQDTGRVADLSPGLMTDLGLETDDEVEVTYPWKE